jgi:hypothetical protein
MLLREQLTLQGKQQLEQLTLQGKQQLEQLTLQGKQQLEQLTLQGKQEKALADYWKAYLAEAANKTLSDRGTTGPLFLSSLL